MKHTKTSRNGSTNGSHPHSDVSGMITDDVSVDQVTSLYLPQVQQHLVEIITAHHVQVLVSVVVPPLNRVHDGRFMVAPGWRGMSAGASSAGVVTGAASGSRGDASCGRMSARSSVLTSAAARCAA